MLEIKKLPKPFQKLSHVLTAYNIKLLEAGIDHAFIVFKDKAQIFASVLSQRLQWLVRTESALQSFRKRIDKLREVRGIFYSLRETPTRTPSGYITDILVVLPESNREVEYKIYDAFGELLRKFNFLLFDLHILKLRKRELYKIIPEGFRRYE